MPVPVPPETLLLVEDDETIGRNLQSGLLAHGYPTTWQRTGAAALIEAQTRHFDVVLLDLGLPDLDGVDVARDLRHRHPHLLIIMLTARGDDIDVVVGLDVGADDYLIKPVGLTVLLARLRAHLRRRHDPHGEPGADADADPPVLVIGELVIDAAARRCRLCDTDVPLRPKEFDLLTELAGQAGTAVRREDLMTAVWDQHWFGSTKTLDVTMAALRRALRDAGTAAGLSMERLPRITTLRGHGYRLETVPAVNDPHQGSGSP